MSTDSTFTPGPVANATVADFAAYMLDAVAERFGSEPIFPTTEDAEQHGNTEEGFIALDQHLQYDGSLARYPVTYAPDALLPLTERLTEQQGMALYHALKARFGWRDDALSEQDEGAEQGACILTAENMSTEDDCTTHDHETPKAGQ